MLRATILYNLKLFMLKIVEFLSLYLHRASLMNFIRKLFFSKYIIVCIAGDILFITDLFFIQEMELPVGCLPEAGR